MNHPRPRFTALLPFLGLALLLLMGQNRPVQAEDVVDLFGGEVDPSEVVQVSHLWSVPKAHPGDSRILAVILDIEDTFHVNPNPAQLQPIESVMLIPTELTLEELPQIVVAEQPRYPKPKMVAVEFFEQPLPFFEGRVPIFLKLQIADDAQPGSYPVKVRVSYQACDDRNCYFPEDHLIEAELIVVATDQAVGEPNAPDLFALFDDLAPADEAAGAEVTPGPRMVNFYFFELDPSAPIAFALLVILAAFGGLLLNFTPCVLPVIPIKILGLAQSAADARRTLLLGAIMSLGVIFFWLVLGGVIAGTVWAAQRGFQGGLTATNQLFQYPLFSLTVGVIIAVMGVGMGGLFAVRLPQWVYAINPKHDSVVGSFGFGIMTAILSTPCTAPFMGAAAAWAATQPPIVTMLVFSSVGLGMALPYFILAANPELVDRLPRTGPGSELLKQIMGVLMLAAAAFFIGIGLKVLLNTPMPLEWWGAGLFVAVAGVWLIVRIIQISRKPAPLIGWITAGVVMIALGLQIALGFGAQVKPEDDLIQWVKYDAETFQTLQSEGNVILLEFTADWCLNCKALERAVLYTDPVIRALRQDGVIPMKIDLTAGDAAGREKLRQVGRVMIPLLMVYDPQGQVVFEADAYTISQVVDAIERARDRS